MIFSQQKCQEKGKNSDLIITNVTIIVLWSFKLIDHKSLNPFYSRSVISRHAVWNVVLLICYRSLRG